MRKFGTSLSAVALAAGLLLNLGGCSKPKKKTEATASATTAAPSATQAKEIDGDAEIVAALKAMAENCQIDEQSARVRACKNREKRELTSLFARRKKDRAASLDTFTNVLSQEDKKLQAAAANVLHSAFRSSLGPANISVEPGAATRLREISGKLESSLAVQVIPAAVHASLAAKQDKELFEFLAAPEHKALQIPGYRHLMAHGRMRVFPKIKEIVAGSDVGAAAAALGSARTMMGATEEEKKQLCDWSTEVLKDPRGAVASKAGALLISCKEKYIDALLDEGESRLKAKTFDGAFARAFRTICTSSGGQQDTAGSKAQCKKTRSLLERAMKSKDVTAAGKGTALMALAMQWPDAKTEKLATSLEGDSDKVIATRAKQALRHMKRRERREEARSQASQPSGAAPKGKAIKPAPKAAPKTTTPAGASAK